MKQHFYVSATILAFSTALISGLSNFLNKFAVAASSDPIIYTTLKNGLVAAALVVVTLSLKRFSVLKSLRTRQWLTLFAVGLIGGGLPFALFFEGLSHTSAITASLIHKTLVIWVAVLAIIFLKERLSWPIAVGIVLVFVGNILVGGFKGFSYSVWELMIFAATLLWAIETLVAKIALRDIPSDIVAGARMACGLFILIPLSVWRSGGIFSPALISPTAWMWTAIASLLLLGYVLTWYGALKRAPAIYVAALLTPATLITNILSAIFITHSVNWQLLASSALFITGLTLIIFYARYLTRHTFAASEQAAGSRVR